MKYQSFCKFQHDFRIGHSCKTAVTHLTQYLFRSIDRRNGKSIAVFVDFTKAFDSLNHGILLNYDG